MAKPHTPLRPTIIVDTREQRPWPFPGVETRRATLKTGDYSILGAENSITLERKSLADLVGSLTQGRKRFWRELERMQTFPLRALIVEGSLQQIAAHEYRSKAYPSAVIGSLVAMQQRFGIPVWLAGDRRHAAALARRWLLKAAGLTAADNFHHEERNDD